MCVSLYTLSAGSDYGDVLKEAQVCRECIQYIKTKNTLWHYINMLEQVKTVKIVNHKHEQVTVTNANAL